MRAMGWLWLCLVGSLKIYVSFAEYSLFYRDLLQKRPMFLRSVLIVTTSYRLSKGRARGIHKGPKRVAVEFADELQMSCT